MGAHVAMDVSVMTEVFGRRTGEALGTERKPLLSIVKSCCCFILSHKVSVSMFSVSPQKQSLLCWQLKEEDFQLTNN